ncbi:hypothetical protein [Nostoc sp. WHI]|uniref:hypothetical protein n=1 Tax=Nostoc sp. WHI TaxID=2650611 RepID=UPI0018C67EBD|nr:hypothetical protein [Nostoc sp. WHI]MBG1265344.1 hypothetical protein [Nostoc sp. WHI]
MLLFLSFFSVALALPAAGIAQEWDEDFLSAFLAIVARFGHLARMENCDRISQHQAGIAVLLP